MRIRGRSRKGNVRRFSPSMASIAPGAFASQHFQNIHSISHVALASSLSRDSEKVRKGNQFIPDSSRSQHRWPTQQERDAACGLKEVLFLPAMMITQKIAMVRKKADKNVLRFRARFDRVKDSAETTIQVANLAVVSGLYDSRQRRVDRVCPNRIAHEGNLFVQMIFLDAAKNEVRHSVGIVHPIERNWRSDRRMRADKRYEREKGPRII